MRWHGGVAGLLIAIAVTGCSPAPPTPFESFLAENREAIQRYQAHLRRHGLEDVAPLEQLLRTSRRWRACSDSPYALAPESLWNRQLPTLRLLARLRKEIPLERIELRSVYRDEAVNRCSGGSSRSQHRQFNAIDFDVRLSKQHAQALCRFWKREGPALNMGLGFYTESALHIDTAGFRTWGKTHRRDSSLCR